MPTEKDISAISTSPVLPAAWNEGNNADGDKGQTDSARKRRHEKERTKRVYPELSKADWLWPLGFLLSMSMLGLQFPLGYLLVLIILINRLKNNPYDFAIMLTIFVGGYGLINYISTSIHTIYGNLVISSICLFLYRKPPIIKKAVGALAVYALAIAVLAMLSEESLKIQIRSISHYLAIVYFVIPLMVFSRKEFKMEVFFKKLIP